MSELLIKNRELFDKKFNKIKSDGVSRLHILADFDKTLTKAFVDGEEIPSLISILRDGKHLTPDYAKKAQSLFNKFHPIEIDPRITNGEKKTAMQEWWETHYRLLIECGLNIKDIESAVQSPKIQPREGLFDFLDLLQARGIPLVILSASGLGVDSIRLFLKRFDKDYDNVRVISNQFEWGPNGQALSIKAPIIHSMNKDETVIKNFPFYHEIKKRKNVILLGDSFGDIDMAQGFQYGTLLSFGFLNSAVKNKIESFEIVYDAIIPEDGPLSPIINLMQKLI